MGEERCGNTSKDSERGSGFEEESDDMDEDDPTARTPMAKSTPLSATPPPFGYSSRREAGTSHETRLHSLEASISEIKQEQQKLGKHMEDLTTCMKTGFEDIKQILGSHTERFGTLDKDVRQLKLRHNSIHMASE
ncbi:hypothetical protein CJ030_MR5G009787 [Morella rubra]|uniref:Uncharacterized protein n=1 Tax=Morella rubra TaxID=262757 RepID=A0A6A1VJG1_9ROSI|nr:hypothetical protein CJ030_MR5G009787 [Morella rubra]